jgi:hypothetical protein
MDNRKACSMTRKDLYMKVIMALLISFVLALGLTATAAGFKDGVKVPSKAELKKAEKAEKHAVADPNKIDKEKDKKKDKHKEKGKSEAAKQAGPNASEKAKERASGKSAVADPNKIDKNKEKHKEKNKGKK